MRPNLIAAVICCRFGRSGATTLAPSSSRPTKPARKMIMGFLATLAATGLASSDPAVAQVASQTPPSVITPLETQPDPNQVNITDGRLRVDTPGLSIPAAPRLALRVVQDAQPYLVGKLASNTGGYVESSVSVHYGGPSAETFSCINDDVCTNHHGHGSMLDGSVAYGGPYTVILAPSGAVYNFDQKAYAHVTAGGTQVLYYASSVTYPDGEVVSYTYQTANYSSGQGPTQYRVAQMSSNSGYGVSFTYQGNDVNYPAWSTVAQATVYSSSAPATPLAQLTFNSSGGVTDLLGRTFTCSGCDFRVGGQVELNAASVTLPGESSAHEAISAANYYTTASVVRDGVTWSYAYANFRSVASPEGYTYDNVVVSGPAGYHQTYNISPGGTQKPNLISSSVDSIGRTTSYSYDASYRPTLITMPEGNSIQIAYDKWGNITSKTANPKPGSGLSATTASAAIDANACNQGQGGVLCYRIVSSIDALGRVTSYTYDSAGRLTQETDPADSAGVQRAKILTYGSSFTAPAQISICGVGTTCGTSSEFKTQYTYLGQTALPLTETRIDGVTGVSLTTSYNYDAAGRLLVVDGPLSGTGDAKYFRYDVVGRKTWEIGPVNADGTRPATRYTYRDADDKVIAVETGTIPDPNSTNLSVAYRTDTTYDSRRYAIKSAVSSGGTIYKLAAASLDDRGQQICETMRMNQAGFASAPTDACTLGKQGANGPDRITRKAYDAAGQLSQIQKAYGVTGLQQNYATYTYSGDGKQTSVTDANGNRASLTYDGLDRLSQWTFPSKTSPGQVNASDYESYGYDAAGNRTSLRKRDGAVLGYQYDALNRIIVKTVPTSATGAAGYNVYYGYDVRGLQTYARFGSSTGFGVTNTYDGFARITSATTAMSGTSKTLTYKYDAASNRTQVAHPEGITFNMAYDAGDRMATASYSNSAGTSPFFSIAYDDLGRRQTTSRGASSTTYGWDAIGRLSADTQQFAGGAGNVTTSFGYNETSQILTRNLNSDDYGFTGAVAVNRNYAVNGLNQYTSAGSAAFTYDANGNLASDGSNNYVYDAENRLVSMTTGSGTALTYDPLGRLWQSSSSSYGITQFLHDGDETAVEYDGSNGAVRRRFFWGPGSDEIVLQDEGGGLACTGGTWYFHPNYKGSTVAVANCSGSRIAVNGYDEWGIPNSTNRGRYQYTGQAWLPELGMYYYKARMYSPTLGRFLQTDPIGYKDQINLYAYVANDPVDGRDPTGTTCQQSGDKGAYTCQIDKVVTMVHGKEVTRNATAADHKQYAGVEKSLTRAVNAAAANGGKSENISFKSGGNSYSFSISSGRIAESLAARTMVANPFGNVGAMNTPNNRLTNVDRYGINPPAPTAYGDAERTRSMEFLHEGIHGSREEARALGSTGLDQLGRNPNDHQDSYNHAANDMLGPN